MPQPVKVSDSLIDAAREAAPLAHRSLASQVEHWAALGRAIEGSLTSEQSAVLKRSAVREPAANPYIAGPPQDPAHVLAEALEHAVSPEFAAQVRESLNRQAGPKYGTHRDHPGYLVRRNADGTVTPGRMVIREFVPADEAKAPRSASTDRSD
jgi:hypothetical protein